MAKQQTIWVVDDDSELRQLLSTYLSEQGYEVRTLNDGKQFTARLEFQRPDLVVLDLMMPVVDGWQVADALKKHPRLCDVPVIVVTAKIMSTMERQRLSGHIRRVIQKNGLSRDQALGQLVDQLQTLRSETRQMVMQ